MVKIYSDDGVYVGGEPPYTEEEELELYRRMSPQPGAKILHGPRPSSTPPSEQELEATVKALIDRRNAVPEGSAEYNEIVRQLGELYDNDDRVGLIAEEYNILLSTLEGTIDLE